MREDIYITYWNEGEDIYITYCVYSSVYFLIQRYLDTTRKTKESEEGITKFSYYLKNNMTEYYLPTMFFVLLADRETRELAKLAKSLMNDY